MRRFAPLLIAAAAPAQLLAHADAPAAAVSSVRPSHSIPFDLYDNRIYVQASGPGFGPSWFLLDTGAQRTHFTSELVERAGLRIAGRVGITGTGTQRIRGAFVAPTVLRIGSLTLPLRRGVSAPAEAMFGAVYAGSGRRFDGVIGYDLFAAYVVQIDYGGRALHLYEHGRPRPLSAGETIPIRIVDRKPYLTATLRFGPQSLPANVHLDTGFGGAVALNGEYVAEQRLLDRIGPTLPSSMRGVGGITEARLARSESISLGNLVLERPIVSLALVQGAGVRGDSAGRIGGQILRRFTVTLDYRARTVTLAPDSAFHDPFEADMSGLALIEDEGAGFLVTQVAEGSAAADAGVRPGDRVVAVAGRPVGAMTLEEVRNILRSPGARHSLRLFREGGEIEVTIVLRRRI